MRYEKPYVLTHAESRARPDMPVWTWRLQGRHLWMAIKNTNAPTLRYRAALALRDPRLADEGLTVRGMMAMAFKTADLFDADVRQYFYEQSINNKTMRPDYVSARYRRKVDGIIFQAQPWRYLVCDRGVCGHVLAVNVDPDRFARRLSGNDIWNAKKEFAWINEIAGCTDCIVNNFVLVCCKQLGMARIERVASTSLPIIDLKHFAKCGKQFIIEYDNARSNGEWRLEK